MGWRQAAPILALSFRWLSWQRPVEEVGWLSPDNLKSWLAGPEDRDKSRGGGP